ncbi:hypothetical protein [Natronincola ferrireducens]|uniref:N-formylglutamate amidohydrolase n=1 Tax=Natronincola ferrireducens TaxID=393762 RepID=A0A1G9D9Q6_9FIRM|nr:hypothetical protein [Natronincola ferrireducens]SDK60587.1 hypothetical protein SAMN05660472_01694 [Natronincola ferrireducens]
MSTSVNPGLKFVTKAFQFEKQFAANNYFGEDKDNLFKYREGSIPIIVSAPHAVKQIRSFKVKKPDIFTGSIALLLGDITNCHVIYRTFTGGGDSNNDINCPYKNFLLKKIKEHSLACLIDLHGLDKKRNLTVDVGTLNGLSIGKEIESIIVNSFKSQNIMNVRFNHYFNADKAGTVVKTIWDDIGIPSFQLEINGLYRDVSKEENWDRFSRIVKSLHLMIFKIYQMMVLDKNLNTIRSSPQVAARKH